MVGGEGVPGGEGVSGGRCGVEAVILGFMLGVNVTEEEREREVGEERGGKLSRDRWKDSSGELKLTDSLTRCCGDAGEGS